MKISIKNIALVIILSSIIGIAVNYLNPEGIPLIRVKNQISWVSDSLFNIPKSDSVVNTQISSPDQESNAIDEIKSNPGHESVNSSNIKNNNIEEENNIKKVEEVKKDDEPKVVEFEEPKNITIEQAYSLFNSNVTFIDARDEADYLAGRISKSINIPYYDFENHKYKLDNLSKEKPVVIYCAGTECDLSELLGNQLSKLGYKQIYIFFGGWIEWQNENYPTEIELE